jgi:hypothetical protein
MLIGCASHVRYAHAYVIESFFLSVASLEHLEMKRPFNFNKSKKPKSLTDTLDSSPEPASSTSTIVTTTDDPVSASVATESTQTIQGVGVTVSVQLSPIHP